MNSDSKAEGSFPFRFFLPPFKKILIGVSGGADSIFLMHLLYFYNRSAKIKLEVAHVHHSLRGKAADKDAEFVMESAWKLGLPCHIKKVKTKKYARANKLSIEMAARKLRHDFFREIIVKQNLEAVALGHTMDDQAETVLLRLARGSALRGLTGMAHIVDLKGLKIVRPLLNIRQKKIKPFLKRHSISWREDKSNRDDQFLRNRVRHEVIPLMGKRLNTQVVEHLANVTEIFREEDALLNSLAEMAYFSCCVGEGLSLKELGKQKKALQYRILLKWLEQNKLSPEKIDTRLLKNLLAIKKGMTIPNKMEVRVSNGVLKIETEKKLPDVQYLLNVPGETCVPTLGLRVLIENSTGRRKVDTRGLGIFPTEAYLRIENGEKIILRNWRKGDRMSPLALNGNKKLQDIFVDNGVERIARSRLPVLVAEEKIIWLPGYQVSRGFEVRTNRQRSIHVVISSLS